MLAVPNESKVQTVQDLDGGIVATELVNVTRKYFERRASIAPIEFSWGATEVKARLLDGIVDVTETGSSLRANNLRIVDQLMSPPRLGSLRTIGRTPTPGRRTRSIRSHRRRLRGAIEARAKVGLKLNVSRQNLASVLAVLPAE